MRRGGLQLKRTVRRGVGSAAQARVPELLGCWPESAALHLLLGGAETN